MHRCSGNLFEVAGVAREELEKRSGEKVVSGENYLAEPEGRKRVEGKGK